MAPASPLQPFQLSLNLVAEPIAVRATLAGILNALPPGALNADKRATLELVLAEVLNNIVEHAYAEQAGIIDLQLTTGADILWCEVLDQGLEMPGGCLPAGRGAAVDVAVEDLPEGGFGWFLIRSLTQDLQYQRVGNVNRLIFSLALHDGAMVA